MNGEISLPIIVTLVQVAMSKLLIITFDNVDMTLDFTFSAGIGNLAGSFVSAYPVAGSFSRLVPCLYLQMCMARFILHANANAKRIFDMQCQNSRHDLANVEHIPIYANIGREIFMT